MGVEKYLRGYRKQGLCSCVLVPPECCEHPMTSGMLSCRCTVSVITRWPVRFNFQRTHQNLPFNRQNSTPIGRAYLGNVSPICQSDRPKTSTRDMSTTHVLRLAVQIKTSTEASHQRSNISLLQRSGSNFRVESLH